MEGILAVPFHLCLIYIKATKNRGIVEVSRVLTVLEGTCSVKCDAVIFPCLPYTDCQ